MSGEGRRAKNIVDRPNVVLSQVHHTILLDVLIPLRFQEIIDDLVGVSETLSLLFIGFLHHSWLHDKNLFGNDDFAPGADRTIHGYGVPSRWVLGWSVGGWTA